MVAETFISGISLTIIQNNNVGILAIEKTLRGLIIQKTTCNFITIMVGIVSDHIYTKMKSNLSVI